MLNDMHEIIINGRGDKSAVYKELIPQICSLVEGERDETAILANVAAAIKEAMGFFWVGFYLVRETLAGNGEELVLGPFQGPVACTRIPFGRGVCGTAWKESGTILVEDVMRFPGHIACSSRSRSEIVVPLKVSGNTVKGVLDIDSDTVAAFDGTDRYYLEEIVRIICSIIWETEK